ncbi:MAG: RagB/SusD family nutrient uptake outer membrane protein [Dysgonamonadaceae bacterium]|jgi:hypothetical protein|nr:RagB/SusD family nutrient uptake outer membrane protein [Dysgonamonadaceae bacterium]
MKYKILSIAYTVGGLLLFACSDFLEEKSQSEVIPTTTTDYRELLVGSGYPNNTEPADFTYYFGDDVELNFYNAEYINSSEALRYSLMYTWQPASTEGDGLGDPVNENAGSTAYYAIYERIKGCNAVLDYIDDAIGPQAEKDRVKAEALAIRAFHYFKLVNLYGEPYNHNKDALGVPLKLNSTMTEDFLPRNTVAEVYDTIVANLKTACALMDPLPILRKNYRINQPATHTFFSRVYLYMDNFEACVAEANKALSQGAVLQDITTGSFAGSTYLNYNNPEIEWMFGADAQANQSTYIPKPDFLDSFDKVNDSRYRFGFAFGYNQQYALVNKWITGVLDPNQSIRTAETVLNRAEANAQLGHLTEAMADLNDLRRTRILGYIDENITDKNQLIEAIRNERGKEFCYENFRWFDLRRYGMPAITHKYQVESGAPVLIYTLREKDPFYTLPLPGTLLLRNPGLVQNPSATMGERKGE